MSQRPAKKPGTSRETKDQTKDDQGPAKKPGANRETRSHQEPPETSRSQQEVPKTTRNHQRPSETTRDHQSHQGARATREPERATRGTSIGNRKKNQIRPRPKFAYKQAQPPLLLSLLCYYCSARNYPAQYSCSTASLTSTAHPVQMLLLAVRMRELPHPPLPCNARPRGHEIHPTSPPPIL